MPSISRLTHSRSPGKMRSGSICCRASIFGKGHLFEPIEGSFDLIVANLPYVAASEAKQLAPEVRHDPPMALYGGETGTELMRELIAAAPPYLRPGGTLALEIGIDQQEELSELMMKKNYRDIRLKNDYAGIGRFLFAQHG